MLALIPQSGDFSGAALGVRSVALLQVPKLAALLCNRNKERVLYAHLPEFIHL
jgi:hypothetical protein